MAVSLPALVGLVAAMFGPYHTAAQQAITQLVRCRRLLRKQRLISASQDAQADLRAAMDQHRSRGMGGGMRDRTPWALNHKQKVPSV